MPTCNAEESTIPVHSNYWEDCTRDRQYNAYYGFNKDQVYEGEFFRDSLHGQGAYTWRNVAVYEGGFYSNSKEGYASLSFADNSYFEGLFVKNQPFGPGILTYPNGRQDAGLWMGRKLIRLSRAVDYIIPRLAPTIAGKIKLLQFKYLLPLNEEFCNSATKIIEKLDCQPTNFPTIYSSLNYDPRSMFFDKEIFDKCFFINELTDFLRDSKDLENGIRLSVELNGEAGESDSLEEIRIPSHCLCQQDEFKMNYENVDEEDSCDRGSFKGELEMGILGYFTKFGTIEGLEQNEEVEESKVLQVTDEEEKDASKRAKILLWNRSELCKDIIKHMFRYRGFEEKLNFNLAKLMLGVRNAFRRTGEKEKQCLQLLKMCSLGPPHAVKDLLCSYEISPNLTDCRGNNSLMFAAAADQHEIIDILLDYGVDVDNFNDEGLTPLNLCLLRRLALTNKISCWETAFLPQEIDQSSTPIDIQNTELQAFQSIASLDRIFGDGMSAHESKPPIQEDPLLAILPAVFTESICSSTIFDNFKIFNLSQITILDLLKSPKNYSLVTVDDEGNGLQSCCSFPTVHPSQKVQSNEPTLKINVKLIPKAIKREEFERSIQKASTDRYLFEFTFKNNPNLEGNKKDKGSVKSSKARGSKAQEKQEEKKEDKSEGTEEMNLELNKRLADIDKTIEKLLKRGANPNISEVPKPSIHLGVYTKDMKTICMLLTHGASPNCQLYANEGLLTPLHVLVLKEPDPINVQICQLLLNFDADPELETSPEFSMSEEEKKLLDENQGRTPLQLLCMRPDLEYGDPNDDLIKIGLLLARVSNKTHYYNGHSCLTLAMLSGNFKILNALLDSKFFDPNNVLGNDRGTALHVLVSTELQKITAFENSMKMCDILIAKGADPLKKFTHPETLVGNCVDYGYREIEKEKDARRTATASTKKDSRNSKAKEKSAGKDYLKDQERVVEYLGEIAKNMAKKKENEKNGKKNRKTHYQDKEEVSERDGKDSRKMEKNKGREESLTESQEKNEINKKQPDSGKNKKDLPEIPEVTEVEKKEPKDNKNEKTYSDDKNLEDKNVKDKNLDNKSLKDKNVEDKKGKNLENKKELKNEKKRKSNDAGGDGKKSKPDIKPDVKESEKSQKREKLKTGTRGSDRSNLKNVQKGNQKGVCSGVQVTTCETFPEKLRQVLLQKYGMRFEIDLNELIMPYVVLRNGELYYRFHKKPIGQKEQYSLI